MNKKLTKTIVTCKIRCKVYNSKTENLETLEFNLDGQSDNKPIPDKVLYKLIPDGYVFITVDSTEFNSTTYEMTLSDFIKHATKIEK